MMAYYPPLVLVAMFGIYLVAGKGQGKLRDRIDYLELSMKREAAQTRDNIYELRNLVWSLNASQDTNTDGDVGNDCSQYVTDMEQKLELFTASQETSMRKLAKGFNTEKRLFRKSTVAQEKITTEHLELINETKTALEDKVAQIEAESKETMAVLVREMGEIKATLADIQAENESLNQTINKLIPECPSGWLSWETSCYLKMTKKQKWASARQKCSYMGAHLAQAESEAEMRYLLPLLDFTTWLGGTDSAIEGTWQWAEGGAIITYLPWASGQPNSFKGDQNCLATDFKQSGKLNDESCTGEGAYVCEKQAN